MSKHTQLPWEMRAGGIYHKGRFIADCSSARHDTPPHIALEDYDNAALIVRAVNAHEKAMAICGAVAGMDSDYGNAAINAARDEFLRLAPEFVAHIKTAKALLAKARGEA